MKKQKIQSLLAEIYDTAPEAESLAVEKKMQDLTANDIHLIRAIDIRGQKGMAAIAGSLRLGETTVRGDVCSLEKRGYVKTVENEVALTAEGEKALAGYKDMIRNGVEEMFTGMSDEEVDTVIKGMEILKECFESVIEECSGTEYQTM